MNKLTYCNPLQIEDTPCGRWLDITATGEDARSLSDYRSIADPSVVYHNGKWILYPSYRLAYVSEDFVHWRHVDIGLPHIRYSPAVVCFRGKWYLQGHSMSELYVADDPLGPFTLCGHMTDRSGKRVFPIDGCFLADGDHLYFYYFFNSQAPQGEPVDFVTGTKAVELDPDRPYQFISDPVTINRFDPAIPWHCYGEYNQNKRGGWIEGQWAFKRNGRYYLLYAGSATQFSSYANGVVYSDEGPLSGFRPQKRHDPLTEKRTGLLRGAGHGCIVEGPNNTLWTFYTSLYTFHHKYERRIGMDPIGIDENGELFCPAVTETPQYAPGVLAHPEQGNDAGLLPLTANCRPYASSHAQGREPIYAVDESVLTWWQPQASDRERTLTLPLGMGTAYDVSAVRLLWRDVGMETLDGIFPGPFQYIVEYRSAPSDTWKILLDASDNQKDLCVDYRTFPAARATELRLRILSSPSGIEPGVCQFTAFGRCAKD